MKFDPLPGETTSHLAFIERRHVLRTLANEGGNVSRAAKRLGLHRRSLQRKLLKIGREFKAADVVRQSRSR